MEDKSKRIVLGEGYLSYDIADNKFVSAAHLRSEPNGNGYRLSLKKKKILKKVRLIVEVLDGR